MDFHATDQPIQGTRIVSVCLNSPGPVAAARLVRLGAQVTKAEPPGGDPMKQFAPAWYDELSRGQAILSIDLKDKSGRERMQELLGQADVLLASFRPSALRRLGLDWGTLHPRFPKLNFVGIVGHLPPHEEKSGHDLTYLGQTGLLQPPELPKSLYVDLAAGERCASQALALIVNRERTGEGSCAWVSLEECAQELAAPLGAGLTSRGGLLGGGSPFYGLYQASDGWLALAALEPHFAARLLSELNLKEADQAELIRIFRERSIATWEAWAAERDIPLVAVRAG